MCNWRNDKILVWIDVFSKPDSTFRLVKTEQDVSRWQPHTEEEKQAFSKLIAKEHRELLKAWYAQFSQLDGTANIFRRILERAVGEVIPLKDDRVHSESTDKETAGNKE